jgi:hypothetical protein
MDQQGASLLLQGQLGEPRRTVGRATAENVATASANVRAAVASDSCYSSRRASCVRDLTSSLRNALRRWYSTVLGLMKS